VILKSVLKKNPIPAGSPIVQSSEEILSVRRLGCVDIGWKYREKQKKLNTRFFFYFF